LSNSFFLLFSTVAASKKDTILFGNGVADAARVQMFINIADNEITPAAATWIYPILGFVPYNKENTDKAKEDLKKTLGAFNTMLATRTYLVGEAPTLADIHVVVALLHLYKMVRIPIPRLHLLLLVFSFFFFFSFFFCFLFLFFGDACIQRSLYLAFPGYSWGCFCSLVL